MRTTRTGQRQPGRGQRLDGEREWVGGRVEAPFYVTEGEPYRPEIILWLELPEGFVVGSAIVHPSDPPAAIAEALRAAMQEPMIGPPRRPQRIRVAEPLLAELVGAVLGDDARIRVAPTPELDAVIRAMAHAAADDDPAIEPESYLESGRVQPQTVADLFRAAQLLFRVAPWRHVSDADVLRVDIPQLGVTGGCLSIIGALGESLGFLLFPSLTGYDRFLDAAHRSLQDGPVDLGTTCLSLNFERGADLPSTMRREVLERGWPVEHVDAHPRVLARERDGASRPLAERDVRIASACAVALAAFCAKHGARAGQEGFGPLCESYTGDTDLTVRFTAPYDAAPLFDVNQPLSHPSAAGTRVGRNDPCPCGSGRKYKKCHIGALQTGSRSEPENFSGAGDAPLVDAIFDWAARRFGTAWAEPLRASGENPVVPSLVIPWCAYHATAGGRRIAEHFLDAQAQQLSAEARAWIGSQLAAWLSIWEVLEVEPGTGARMVDLLSGATRFVRDRAASQTLVRRATVLARVVDHRDTSTLQGISPRPLPPWEAAEVVRRTRARLRLRRAVPPERLRDEAVGRFMLARWAEAVADLDHRISTPPVLQNTDGDPLLLTTDHFALDAAARRAVETHLAALGAVADDETDGSAQCYAFLQPARDGEGETIIGRVRVSDAALTLETNSVARADRLRQRLGEACGALLRHRIREHRDPRAPAADIPRRSDAAAAIDPSEKARIEREFKARHYQRWLDEPLPALSGLTPKAAVRSAAGRQRVDVLLKDIEYREALLPSEQRFDFAPLRAALGLDR